MTLFTLILLLVIGLPLAFSTLLTACLLACEIDRRTPSPQDN